MDAATITNTTETNTATTTEKTKCSNCKCWRESDDFIGKNGNTVKRCKKCREKDDRQKSKPEVKEKRREIQKEKKYYVAYREKKKQEDIDAYRKHNAELMKAWRNKNKEHVSAWKKKNSNARYISIKQQATLKGIQWNDDMTKNVCFDMIQSSCFYCDRNDPECLNGIDRMDNSKGYSIENCVPCCKYCNFMKKALDAHTFVERCVHIATCQGHGEKTYKDNWRPSKHTPFDGYKKRAHMKGLAFEINEEDFFNICSAPCFYCHRQNTYYHSNGIDRIDNSIGYIMNNCVSCCAECNSMKADMDVATFVETCKMVADRQAIIHIPEIKRCYYTQQCRAKSYKIIQ